MASNLADLTALLRENEMVMEEFSAKLTEELDCIVSLNVENLLDVCTKKEMIMMKLQEIQSNCKSLIQKAGNELGLRDITELSPLIMASGKAGQVDLKPLQQRLLRLSSSVKRQQDTNKKVLEGSISMIKGSMSLFARLIGGGETYGARGIINSGRACGGILRQEI